MLGNSFDLSDDGKTLAIVTSGGVILADTETMTRQTFIPLTGTTTDLDISADGSMLVATHRIYTTETRVHYMMGEHPGFEVLLTLFNLESQTLLFKVRLRENRCSDLSASSPVFSPDGKSLAVVRQYQGTDGSHIVLVNAIKGGIYVLDRNGRLVFGPIPGQQFENFTPNAVFRFLAHATSQMLLSPDARFLYQLHPKYILRKLSIMDGSKVGRLGEKNKSQIYAINRQTTMLAMGGFEGGGVQVWSVGENKLLSHLVGHSDIVNGLAFSPDANQLATASTDGTVNLWNMSNGYGLHVWDTTNGNLLGIYPPNTYGGMLVAPDQKSVWIDKGSGIEVWGVPID